MKLFLDLGRAIDILVNYIKHILLMRNVNWMISECGENSGIA